MYCLQALIPLVFLPTPAASPLLVVALIASIYLTHRPCIYCGVLFAALLWSTCAWSESGACWIPGFSTGGDAPTTTASLLVPATEPTTWPGVRETILSWLAPVLTRDGYVAWNRAWMTPTPERTLLHFWPDAGLTATAASVPVDVAEAAGVVSA
ncbi:hypothetical protein AMAG_04696 [Allomyces macrogynus ATCC 38327]|uniref:Uncharacterized protein n=1 Tax=Allomyces macrogynus (strain ATCC 38327) TaxID=578462 RepID=A0A0L0S601_ALLM3|nr:hypothetical protein AMAG_04696 [Allomyces macrogynus ATCC 38327]|eukprot:KNE57851.1 hypothetical protein AMAG_04696 [Allomyces macrogynus ATCC 38327]